METLKAIRDRISVRQYSDKEIGEAELQAILEAGMSGPTAVNARPWSFIVVRDPEMLNKMADTNGRAAEPLRKAAGYSDLRRPGACVQPRTGILGSGRLHRCAEHDPRSP